MYLNVQSHGDTVNEETTGMSATQDYPPETETVTDDKKPRITDFELQQTIGTGNFGKVVHAISKKHAEEESALKIITKSSIETMKYANHVLTELKVMQFLKQFNFPGFVKLKN